MTDVLLAMHFLGLMMGAGGGFGSAIAMRRAAKLPAEQAAGIRTLGSGYARFSSIGLILMLTSGALLVTFKYDGIDAMPPLFWVKMLFAAIIVELTYAAVKKGDTSGVARLPVLGPIAGLSSLLATIFAVLTFH
jgi:hypothetical protein